VGRRPSRRFGALLQELVGKPALADEVAGDPVHVTGGLVAEVRAADRATDAVEGVVGRVVVLARERSGPLVERQIESEVAGRVLEVVDGAAEDSRLRGAAG
jgi:hypothetical protein